MPRSYRPPVPPPSAKLKPHHPPRLDLRWALLPQQVRLRVVSVWGRCSSKGFATPRGRRAIMGA